MSSYAHTNRSADDKDVIGEILSGGNTVIYDTPSLARPVNRMENALVEHGGRIDAVFPTPALALYGQYTVTIVVDMSRSTFSTVHNASGGVVVLAERVPYIMRRVIRSLAFAQHGLRRERKDLTKWKPSMKIQILAANCPQTRKQERGPRHVTFSEAVVAPAPKAKDVPLGVQTPQPQASSDASSRLDVILAPTDVNELDSPDQLARCDTVVEKALKEYRRRALEEEVEWPDGMDLAATIDRVAAIVPTSAVASRAQSIVVVTDLRASTMISIAERILLQTHKLRRKSLLFNFIDLSYDGEATLFHYCTRGFVPRGVGNLAVFLTQLVHGHIIRLPESVEEQPTSSHYHVILGLDHYTSQMTPDPSPDIRLGLALTAQRIPELVLQPAAATGSPSSPRGKRAQLADRTKLWLRTSTLPLPPHLTASTALIMVTQSIGTHGWNVTAEVDGKALVRFRGSLLIPLSHGDVQLCMTGHAVTGSNKAPQLVMETYFTGSEALVGVARVVWQKLTRAEPAPSPPVTADGIVMKPSQTTLIIKDLLTLGRDLHDLELAQLTIGANPEYSREVLEKYSSFSGCVTDFYTSFFVKFFTVLVNQSSSNKPYDFIREASKTLGAQRWQPILSTSAFAAANSGVIATDGGLHEEGTYTAASWFLNQGNLADTFLDSKPLLILQAWQPKVLEGFECYPVQLRLIMSHVFYDQELLTKRQELLLAFYPRPDEFPGVTVSSDDTDLTAATIHRILQPTTEPSTSSTATTIHPADASAILTKKERRMISDVKKERFEMPFAFSGLLASSQTEANWLYDANHLSGSSESAALVRLLVEWRVHHAANPFRLLYLQRQQQRKTDTFFALLWRPARRALEGESDEAVAEFQAIDFKPGVVSVAYMSSQQMSTMPNTSSPEAAASLMRRGSTGCFPSLASIDGIDVSPDDDLIRTVHQDAKIIHVCQSIGALLSDASSLPFAGAAPMMPKVIPNGGSVSCPPSLVTLLPEARRSYATVRIGFNEVFNQSCLSSQQRGVLRERLRTLTEALFRTVLPGFWAVDAQTMPKHLAKGLHAYEAAGAPQGGDAVPSPHDVSTPQGDTLVGFSVEQRAPMIWFLKNLLAVPTSASLVVPTQPPSGWSTPLPEMPSNVSMGSTADLSDVNASSFASSSKRGNQGSFSSAGAPSVSFLVTRLSEDVLKRQCFGMAAPTAAVAPQISDSAVCIAVTRITDCLALQALIRRGLDNSDLDLAPCVFATLTRGMSTYDAAVDMSRFVAVESALRNVSPGCADNFKQKLLRACVLDEHTVAPIGNSSWFSFVDANLESPPLLLNFAMSVSCVDEDGEECKTNTIQLSRDQDRAAQEILAALALRPRTLSLHATVASYPRKLCEWFTKQEARTATLEDFADVPSGSGPLPVSRLPAQESTRVEAVLEHVLMAADGCAIRRLMLCPAFEKDTCEGRGDLVKALAPCITRSKAYLCGTDSIIFSSKRTHEDCRRYEQTVLVRLAEVAPSLMSGVRVWGACSNGPLSLVVCVDEPVTLVYISVQPDAKDVTSKQPTPVSFYAAGDNVTLKGALVDAVRRWIRNDWTTMGTAELMAQLKETNQAADDLIPRAWGEIVPSPAVTGIKAPFCPPGLCVRCLKVSRRVKARSVVSEVHQHLDILNISNRDGCFFTNDTFFRIVIARSSQPSDPDAFVMHAESTPILVGAKPPTSLLSPSGNNMSSLAKSSSDVTADSLFPVTKDENDADDVEYIDLHLYGAEREAEGQKLRDLVIDTHNDTVINAMGFIQELNQASSAMGVTPERLHARCPDELRFSLEEAAALRPVVDGFVDTVKLLGPVEQYERFIGILIQNVDTPHFCLCPMLQQEAQDPFSMSSTGNNFVLMSPQLNRASVGSRPVVASMFPDDVVTSPSTPAQPLFTDLVVLMVNGKAVINSNIYSLRLAYDDDGDVWRISWYSSRRHTSPAELAKNRTLAACRDAIQRALHCAYAEYTVMRDPVLHDLPALGPVSRLRDVLLRCPQTDAPTQLSTSLFRLERTFDAVPSAALVGWVEAFMDQWTKNTPSGARVILLSSDKHGGWRTVTGCLSWQEAQSIQRDPEPRLLCVLLQETTNVLLSAAELTRSTIHALWIFPALYPLSRAGNRQVTRNVDAVQRRSAAVESITAVVTTCLSRGRAFETAILRSLGIFKRQEAPPAPRSTPKAGTLHGSTTAASGVVPPVKMPPLPLRTPIPFIPSTKSLRLSGVDFRGAPQLVWLVASRCGIDPRAFFSSDDANRCLVREGMEDDEATKLLRALVRNGTQLRGQWASGVVHCEEAIATWARKLILEDQYARFTQRLRIADESLQLRHELAARSEMLRNAWLARDSLSEAVMVDTIAQVVQVSPSHHVARVADREVDIAETILNETVFPGSSGDKDEVTEAILGRVNTTLDRYAEYLQNTFPALRSFLIDPDATPIGDSKASSALKQHLDRRFGIFVRKEAVAHGQSTSNAATKTYTFRPKLRYLVLPVESPIPLNASPNEAGLPSPTPSAEGLSPMVALTNFQGPLSLHSPGQQSNISESFASQGRSAEAQSGPLAGFVVLELSLVKPCYYSLDMFVVHLSLNAMPGTLQHVIDAADHIKERLNFASVMYDLVIKRCMLLCNDAYARDVCLGSYSVLNATNRLLIQHRDRPAHALSAVDVAPFNNAVPTCYCVPPVEVTPQQLVDAGIVSSVADCIDGIEICAFATLPSCTGDADVVQQSLRYVMARAKNVTRRPRRGQVDFSAAIEYGHRLLVDRGERLVNIYRAQATWSRVARGDESVLVDDAVHLARYSVRHVFRVASESLRTMGVDWMRAGAAGGPLARVASQQRNTLLIQGPGLDGVHRNVLFHLPATFFNSNTASPAAVLDMSTTPSSVDPASPTRTQAEHMVMMVFRADGIIKVFGLVGIFKGARDEGAELASRAELPTPDARLCDAVNDALTLIAKVAFAVLL